MNIAILLLIIKLTYAGTNELCMAMSSRCQLSAERVNRFLHLVSEFTQKLELAFHQASNTSAQYKDVLRELDAPYVWLLLTSIAPTLLEDLKVVRDEVTRLDHELTLEKSCLDWINLLLGDEKSYFSGSYLELSLSATKYTKLAELSTKQALFVRLELRRMHIEREYCWSLPRSEEMLALYCSYLIVYTLLVNRTVAQVILMYAQKNTISLTLIPFEPAALIQSHSLDNCMGFFKKHVDPQRDFFMFNEQIHLRKSSNIRHVYQKWLAILELIPNVAIRREYFDEGKELLFNFKRIESHVGRMYKQKNNLVEILKWNSNDLSNLTVAFGLVDSLISFQREQIAVSKVRYMLLEVIECMKCLKVVHKLNRHIQ